MRTISVALAAALLMAVCAPTAHAVDPLVDQNRAALIGLLGDDYDPNALDSSDPTDATPRTMAQAVDETAVMLTEFGIDLERMLAAHEDAQPGAFPIVSSAAGAGILLEIGLWPGQLPIRCNTVHVHAPADAPAGPDKLLVSPLSHETQVNVAAGTDTAVLFPQVVTYTDEDIFIVGDLANGCIEFELCAFGICVLSFLAHAAGTLTGVITNDVTGTGAPQFAHAAAEPLL